MLVPDRGGLGYPFDGTTLDDATLIYKDSLAGWTAERRLLGSFHKRLLNRYFGPGITADAAVTLALAANTLYAVPFMVPGNQSFNSIAFHVTSAVAGNARIGLYNDSGTYPNIRFLDSGNISVGSTGFKTFTIDQTLTGLYWLVIISDVAPTVAALSPSAVETYLGFSAALNTQPATHYTKAQTFGALPQPFPAGASLVAGANIPNIALRRSA